MRYLVPTVLVLLVAGAVPAAAADSDICVRRNDIKEWGSPTQQQLVLENYARHKVLLNMTSGCQGFGVYDNFQIAGPVESSASCVSVGDTVRTVYAGEPGRCSILSVTPFDGPMPPKKSR